MAVLESCLRVLSGVLQVVFALCAIGLIISGCISGFVVYITNGPETLRAHLTIVPSGLSVIFALILLILVIIGCCGVCRQSVQCMQTYSALLLVLALAHLALGAYCVVVYSKSEYAFTIKNKAESEFERMVEHYTINSVAKDKVDMTQEWLECCGAREPLLEYKNYKSEMNFGNWDVRLPQEPDQVPNTCCRNTYPCTTHSNDYYNESCRDKVGDGTVYMNSLIGWCSVAVGALELFAALLSICLSCCVWSKSIGSWR